MGRRGKPFARVEAPTHTSEFYGRDEVTRHHAKRQRPTRHQAPPPTLPNVDVHGIIFAVVAIVFVVYPLAQLAFSLGEQ